MKSASLSAFGENEALVEALLHLAWAGAGPWSLDARRAATPSSRA
jgi:uncharacterized membrane protein YphA (DoxX/SURF4 family)